MRKSFLFVFLCCFSCFDTAYAQLKVDSLGNVGIKTSTSNDYATCIQSVSNPRGTLHVFRQPTGNYDPTLPWSMGIYTRAVHSFDIDSYGMRAQANSNLSTGIGVGRCFGVFGQAYGATNGYNYGLYGVIGDQNGAGVYGTTVYDMGQALDKKYAGYFRGPVKVQGDLTITGNICGIVLGASSPSEESSTANVAKGTPAERLTEQLTSLDVSTFYHTLPTKYSTSAVDTTEEDIMLTPMEEQILSKQHYGLDSEQLEKVFPDLVYMNEDGTKSINYVEMVPVLVQVVKELKTQVDSLLDAGKDGSCFLAPKHESHGTSASLPTISTEARLYQNTPNPFTERTEIRFSLPLDARNAYICIFDMQGKMLRQIPVEASMQSVTINGYEFSAGIYLYSLVVGGKEIDTKRMILSK